MGDRPEFRAMFVTDDGPEFLKRYAAWCRLVSGRVAPILGAIGAPGVGDDGAQVFAGQIEKERRVGTTRAMERLQRDHGLKRGVTLQRAVDIAWTLNAPEVHDRLVRRCGWSPGRYEAWLAGQLIAALAR